MKKKLVIYWGNPYMFEASMLPILPALANYFSVYLMVEDYYFPFGLDQILNERKKNGQLKEFWVMPDVAKTIQHHLYIRKYLKTWRELDFDLALNLAEIQIFERYLYACILPKKCIKVCFFPYPGYLLMKDALARRLLGMPANTAGSVNQVAARQNLFQRICSKIKNKPSATFILLLIFQRICEAVDLLKVRVYKSYRFFMSRIVLPAILVGKVFRLRKYDNLTQMGSGASDAYVFSDELEMRAFERLVQKGKFFLASYPTSGLCRCHGEKPIQKAVLLPLSIFMGRDQVSEDCLYLFYRDISIVLSNTGATSVHLRPHPRETGKWVRQVEDFLKSKGIHAVCVDSDKPIRSIICDYVGIAGPLSTTLREGRASCDHIFSVGFVGISKYFFIDPKLVYGSSEGVGWIEADGAYDPAIFRRDKYVSIFRKNVAEVLWELENSQKIDG